MKLLPLFLLLSTGVVEHTHDDRVGARDCLALVVFSEARGESWLGQATVAQTVINRAKAEGNGICPVAEAAGQFHGLERWDYPREPGAADAQAWAVARQVTDAVIEGEYVVSPPACAAATHFYRTGTEIGRWGREMEVVCVIENHTFLRAVK